MLLSDAKTIMVTLCVFVVGGEVISVVDSQLEAEVVGLLYDFIGLCRPRLRRLGLLDSAPARVADWHLVQRDPPRRCRVTWTAPAPQP